MTDQHTEYVVVVFDKWDDRTIDAVYGPFPSLTTAQTFTRQRWPWPGPEFRKVSNQRLTGAADG